MKTIGIRELLRGGYKDLTEPVMVMSNNRPIAIWEPTNQVPNVSEPGYFHTGLSSSTFNSTVTTTVKER